jgi:hypothetical protein
VNLETDVTLHERTLLSELRHAAFSEDGPLYLLGILATAGAPIGLFGLIVGPPRSDRLGAALLFAIGVLAIVLLRWRLRKRIVRE